MRTRPLIVPTAVWSVVLSAAPAVGQTVTTNVPSVVTSAQEWAATSMKDPIDMNQWTDVGWQNYSIDQPFVNLSGISQGICTASSGASPSTESGSSCFKATKSAGDGNLFILDSPIATLSADLHKSGTHFPIDASTYTTIVFRMRVSDCSSGCIQGFIWWPTGLYTSNSTTSQSVIYNQGWAIYFVDLPSLGIAVGSTTWANIIQALRMNLPGPAGASVEIDWIRLVPATSARTISWSGFAGAVDIYLDNNTTTTDGNLGIIAKQATDRSLNLSSGSFPFDPAGLAPGTYYAKACPTGTTTNCSYSSAFTVNDIPTLTFTSPSPEGSSDDFATTVLGNAWDMTSTSDLDYYLNHGTGGINQGLSVATILDAVSESGAAVPAFQALFASQSTVADPQIYPLWYNNTPAPGRGQTFKIDANKYHILTIESAVPDRARDVTNGSVARVLWQVEGERGSGGNFPRENISADIIVNHRAGYNVLNTITADMKTLSLETDGSPSTTGWRGNIESFRYDIYEQFGIGGFANNAYYFKRIKLAAKEQMTAGTTYNIAWAYTDTTSSGATLTLSYDTDTNPASGLTTIVSGLNPAFASSYSWNTTGVPNGTYYIYASYSDGYNSNGSYSRWPIVIGPLTGLSAAPSLVNIIATKSGPSLIHKSPPQTVTLSMTGASVAWTASANQPWVEITGGSGTGSGQFTVSVINPSDVIGSSSNLSATITLAAPSIGATSAVTVTLRLKPAGTSDLPFGSFDTPVSGSTAVSGSFAVTGWALDDIGINRVEIWRDRAAGETTPVFTGPGPANGRIYIADGFFVSGARPDVAAAHSDHPFHTRAGWGYLLLSYGLHNQGNGPFTLYAFAYDVEGNIVTLGSKSITVSNNTATRPFGSIDTPTYGQTVSGSFFNFGWALTPNATPSCTITNGNVYMSIDSGTLAPVSYGDNRTDIAAAFPGFSNGGGAGGNFLLNTSTLTNGTHQIGWYVVDSCNRAEGVGSRFFNVLNSGSSTVPLTAAAGQAAVDSSLARTVVDAEPVRVRRLNGDWTVVEANSRGVRVVAIDEGDRVEIELPRMDNATYAGADLSGGARGGLPIGSSLDAATGTFYWQPAAGFLGGFDLEFVATTARERRTSYVRVVVGPPMRTAIDVPYASQILQQPFWLSGWTADLAAAEGTGIDAVHVWAYFANGRPPVFVGHAQLGDARPDVAAVYGEPFLGSAYNLLVTRLTPGDYQLVVFPHRASTNTFEGVQVVGVRVR